MAIGAVPTRSAAASTAAVSDGIIWAKRSAGESACRQLLVLILHPQCLTYPWNLHIHITSNSFVFYLNVFVVFVDC